MRRAREQAQRVQCMSNLRQVTQAFTAYATDHDGQFLSLDSGIAQVGIASPSDSGQVIVALYPYLHSSRVFHCPADPRDNALSYSPNDILGAVPPLIGWSGFIHGVSRYTKVADCSNTFAMIEEFDLHPKQANTSGGFAVQPAPATIWIDTPGVAHGDGSCITFLDGHCDFWTWSDPRTLAFPAGTHMARTSGSADLIRLQGVLGGN
jgi:hypothetical protein